jgi:NAD(P)-dependent dehydrogenase (short-subunit alcohol dehydrogenase family)
LKSFQDKVAVVTGAGAGLGAAIAGVLAREGMQLVIADIDDTNALGVAETLSEGGADARALQTDVGDPASLANLAAFTEEQFGACHLVCANVGVQRIGRADALRRDDWEWLLRVNVLGTVGTVDALLPLLRRQEGDTHVVITSSVSGFVAAPRLAAYTASKYAVTGYAETLRLELAEEGIGVTLVHPGGMATTHLASSAAARPSELGSSPELTNDDALAVSAAMARTPEDVAEPAFAVRHLVAAIREDRPYLVTHGSSADDVRRRFALIEQAAARAND